MLSQENFVAPHQQLIVFKPCNHRPLQRGDSLSGTIDWPLQFHGCSFEPGVFLFKLDNVLPERFPTILSNNPFGHFFERNSLTQEQAKVRDSITRGQIYSMNRTKLASYRHSVNSPQKALQSMALMLCDTNATSHTMISQAGAITTSTGRGLGLVRTLQESLKLPLARSRRKLAQSQWKKCFFIGFGLTSVGSSQLTKKLTESITFIGHWPTEVTTITSIGYSQPTEVTTH
jgi:hypothetical protein